MGRCAVVIGLSLLIVIGLLCSKRLPASSQAAKPAADVPAEPALAAAPAKVAPGLMLTLQSLVKDAASEGAPERDVRSARLVALYVPDGASPSPFLPAGPFRATWEGNLSVLLKDDYTFSASGRGKIEVQLGDKVLLRGEGEDLTTIAALKATLARGKNKLVVRYESPAKGLAAVRLYWSSAEFGREPLPLSLVDEEQNVGEGTSHDAAAHAVRAGQRLREGRELVATLRCLRCHSDGPFDPKKYEMPELHVDAPALADVGQRLQRAWMAHWIDSPRSLRPSAQMPALFHPDAPRKLNEAPSTSARDVAAYLASLGKPAPAPAAAEEKTVQAGGRLFGHLGCIGCHTLPANDDWDKSPERIPLRFVAVKWQPTALEEFLKQPDRHYAWIRMPNFQLTKEEAAKLTAFLLAPARVDLAAARQPVGDAEKGRTLVQSSGCLNCHSLQLENSFRGKAFSQIGKDGWSRGCLSANAKGTAPDFGLSQVQRESVVAWVVRGRGSLVRESPNEFAERQIRALRCGACHKRDGKDDLWSELKEEVAELTAGEVEEEDGKKYPADQSRPALTWTGEKLRPEWTAAFLAGKLPYRPRPYLRARMPVFAQRADLLSRGLAFEHGYPPHSLTPPAADPKLAEVGRQLAKKSALACVACHDIGKVEAVGVFEAPGPNFMYVRDRLYGDYYDRWVRKPLRLDLSTKMPTFFLDGKTSTAPGLLDGDPVRQREGLWHYLLKGEKITPPDE